MRIDTLVRGALLVKASGDLCAEHDQIWIGGWDPEELSKEVLEELEHLGFFWDEGAWSHFT